MCTYSGLNHATAMLIYIVGQYGTAKADRQSILSLYLSQLCCSPVMQPQSVYHLTILTPSSSLSVHRSNHFARVNVDVHLAKQFICISHTHLGEDQ